VLVLAWVLLPNGSAMAHPLVDEGRRRYEEAEFVGALDALARAEASDDLERDELAAAYELQALVQLAMGNADAMHAALERLVVVSPDHTLDRRVPPAVARAFAEVRSEAPAPLRVVASVAARGDGVSVEARVERDELELLREVRVHGRAAGSDAWDVSADAPLFVEAPPGSRVEYYAEAVGPGGVALASTGTADDPLSTRASRAATESPMVEPDAEGGVSPWLFVGIGAVVAAVATVLLIVLLTPEPDTQLAPFTVEL
jgi:hypothetical protein